MDATLVGYAVEWLSLAGRWVHLIAGIAWIGSSFYFVWLDNHLLAPADPELKAKGVGGELWAVHGGGFYNAQKYRVAPGTLPPVLHWFYWEAYSTFLSGFFLLALLYYGKAELYLIDPSIAALSKPQAIAIGLAFLVGGWLGYDRLCRTALVRNGRAFGTALFALLAFAAWGLCHLFSGRGAYIQFGAMLGTIMVANVFFVIIPAQREMVRAKQAGREPDPQFGINGKLRSTHNTYFTLPVLFTMISNHYAMTYAATYNWLVLVAIGTAGVSIRMWFVLRHKAHERGGKTPLLPAAIGVALLLAVAFALAPAPSAGHAKIGAAERFARVQLIVRQRCATCHAAVPTQAGFAAAPKGVPLDKPELLVQYRQQIGQQVGTRAMPLGNLTNMTEAERAELLAWTQHGER
jgi:uncharacterized membrane protein